MPCRRPFQRRDFFSPYSFPLLLHHPPLSLIDVVDAATFRCHAIAAIDAPFSRHAMLADMSLMTLRHFLPPPRDDFDAPQRRAAPPPARSLIYALPDRMIR
jgi:hypothetical protein